MKFKMGDIVRIKYEYERSWNKLLIRVPLLIIGFSGNAAQLTCKTWSVPFYVAVNELESYPSKSIVEILNDI